MKLKKHFFGSLFTRSKNSIAWSDDQNVFNKLVAF